MNNNFFSQNQSRYYPFDEDEVPNRNFTEEELRLLKQGIVDIGITYTGNEISDMSLTLDMAFDAINRFDFTIKLTYVSGALRFTETLSMTAMELSDWMTLKMSDENLYGYIVIGRAAAFDSIQSAIHDVPIQRSRLKLLQKQHVSAVYVSNLDRSLARYRCADNDWILDRPASWTQGQITSGYLELKEGFNCSLMFENNNVIIAANPAAGMGTVTSDLSLGTDENGLDEPLCPTGRHDNINDGARYVTCLFGASGQDITLTYDPILTVSSELTDPAAAADCDELDDEADRSRCQQCVQRTLVISCADIADKCAFIAATDRLGDIDPVVCDSDDTAFVACDDIVQ